MSGLRDQDIICFTYADWHASWSTPQQVMTRLCPSNRILYVDQPRSFLYNLKAPDPQGAGQWHGAAVQEVREDFHVYHLPHCFLPVGGLPLPIARCFIALNSLLIAWLVRRAAHRLGFKNPILWNFSILHGYAGKYLPVRLRIYDIADEWARYIEHPAARNLTEHLDAWLTRTADLVFPSTPQIAAARAHLHDDMPVIAHGADYDHFSRAQHPDTEIPDDLSEVPHPIVGAVGVMDPARFDEDLIVHLSGALPDWSIVLVGPARKGVDLARLEACPNVYLTGNRPIAELPNYLKALDVALIPYRVNEATANIYPLKLPEYLAAGKPVVAPAMPVLAPFGDVVHIVENHDAFVEAVRLAYHEQGAGPVAKRQAVGRDHSWDQRVAEKSDHVMRHLGRPGDNAEGATDS
jgi:glycosyltransferase involved in cell wall biosynthesis